ncbi:MAG: hypothetical protein QMD03_05775, partial [Syntrophales bacterium]|nr:hypothetical protein [Syntrophales bacterium]
SGQFICYKSGQFYLLLTEKEMLLTLSRARKSSLRPVAVPALNRMDYSERAGVDKRVMECVKLKWKRGIVIAAKRCKNIR